MTFEIIAKEQLAQFPTLGKFPAKFFMNNELSDVKIYCEDEIFDCHKFVLSGQSEVFKTMLIDNEMTEARTGEINITDISANTMKDLLFFLYNGKLDDSKITGQLLIAAKKYEILHLIHVCVQCMMENLTRENVVNVMISAYLIDQKILFGHACQFIFSISSPKNQVKDKIIETNDWKDLKEKNPILACKMMEEALFCNSTSEFGDFAHMSLK